MTLDDLVSKVAEQTGKTKKETRETVKATFDAINGCVTSGDQILVPELGRFGSKDRAARKGSNPSTGEKVEIPARKVPTFSYTKKVKDSVGELPVGE